MEKLTRENIRVGIIFTDNGKEYGIRDGRLWLITKVDKTDDSIRYFSFGANREISEQIDEFMCRSGTLYFYKVSDTNTLLKAFKELYGHK